MLSSLVVKPFIFGDISRLKGPYISNFCVIVGQVFYLEENYSLDGVLSGGEYLLALCLCLVGVNFVAQHQEPLCNTKRVLRVRSESLYETIALLLFGPFSAFYKNFTLL